MNIPGGKHAYDCLAKDELPGKEEVRHIDVEDKLPGKQNWQAIRYSSVPLMKMKSIAAGAT